MASMLTELTRDVKVPRKISSDVWFFPALCGRSRQLPDLGVPVKTASIAVAAFEGIEKQMDELARLYAETHDEKVKAELEELSWRLKELTSRAALISS